MATELAKAYVQIIPSAKGVKENLTKIMDDAGEEAGKSSGGKFSAAFGGGLKAMTGLATAAAGAATAVGASAVAAGMEFDSAMSQVVATMGYSMEELADEGSDASKAFKSLRGFAQQMGSTTAFSATEAAEALNFMALAGYDAETSMTMLPNVLNLAAAGGIDLASASDMVTDAQTALGLSLEETAIMVDQMAVTASKSNTSVAQLGEAYLTIGANARDLSGGTNELSTMLGVLADNGIKGAEAGTHLRNIMLAMNPTTTAAKEAWESLGVTAYDTEGNLRALPDVMGDIDAAMTGMTSQEKQDILSSMFNKTDLASINALLGTTSERYTELSANIDDSANAAQAMANVQLDNLSGSVTLFQSALEGAKIAISDQVTPTLKEMVDFGSNAVSELSLAFQEGGLTGAMEALGTLLSEGLQMVVDKLPEVVSAGLSLLSSLIQGIVNNLPMVVDATVQILGSVASTILENLPLLISSAFSIVNQLASSIVDAVPGMGPSIVSIISNIAQVILENLPTLLASGLSILEAIVNGIIETIPYLIGELPKVINGIINFFTEAIPMLIEVGIRLVSSLVENMPEIISNVLAALPGLITKVCGFFADNIPLIIEAGIQLLVALVSNMPKIIKEIVKALPDIIKAIVKGIVGAVDQLADAGLQLIKGLWNGINDAKQWLKDKISGWVDSVVDSIKDFFGIHSPSRLMRDEVGKQLAAGMAEGITDNTDMVDDAMKELEQEASATITRQVNTDLNASSTYGGSLSVQESSAERRIIDLLERYLPEAAEPSNVNVSLAGNAKNLFNMVRSEAQRYTETTGNFAFS